MARPQSIRFSFTKPACAALWYLLPAMRDIEGALRRPLGAVLLLSILVCCAGTFSHSLWSPDEPTGAAVGRAMADSGDLIVPRLNGEPFLEKPPLYWWVQVAAFRA